VSEYTTGDTYATRTHPRFCYKPSSPGYSGGGYAWIRSTERRPDTPGDGAGDVFVYVHRLAAVAWCLDGGTLGEDVRLSDLDGKDVHHRLGMPAANGEGWIELVDHGRHAEITQADRRAWAADAKDASKQSTIDDSGDGCVRCDDELDTACISPDWDGRACPDCARTLSDGGTIEVI